MTGIKKVIIATHGTLAEGFKHTLELICGPQDDIRVMNFYCNNASFETEIKQMFTELTDDAQLIVCTDIQFGSVNQIFVKEAIKHRSKNIQILSGVNLPLLLEIVTTPGILSQEMISDMIEKSSKQIAHMNLDVLFNQAANDEFF